MKYLVRIKDAVVQAAWKKLVDPKVERGRTAWPKSQADLLKYGIRLDYDGVVTKDGHWRDKNGGTHAVITSFLIKKKGSAKDVDDAVGKAFKDA